MQIFKGLVQNKPEGIKVKQAVGKKTTKKARNQQIVQKRSIMFRCNITFLKVMTFTHRCYLSLMGILQQVATKQDKNKNFKAL